MIELCLVRRTLLNISITFWCKIIFVFITQKITLWPFLTSNFWKDYTFVWQILEELSIIEGDNVRILIEKTIFKWYNVIPFPERFYPFWVLVIYYHLMKLYSLPVIMNNLLIFSILPVEKKTRRSFIRAYSETFWNILVTGKYVQSQVFSHKKPNLGLPVPGTVAYSHLPSFYVLNCSIIEFLVFAMKSSTFKQKVEDQHFWLLNTVPYQLNRVEHFLWHRNL